MAKESEENLLSEKVPNWYYKVIDYINDEYSFSITLNHLSSAANVHPNYISRKFKKINGLTIGEYIRKVRLEKAFESLTLSQNNLTQVSLANGFYDQPHFTRAFKQVYGSNPKKFTSDYRKLIPLN